jgi:drug/metabolite transporter (DMT)-like permease
VPPELSVITDQITLSPAKAVGIPIALAGAIIIAIGTQMQHSGVSRAANLSESDTTTGLSMRQLLRLLKTPTWVFGTLLLGIAILFQLTSLAFSPLIVVQPLGAVALVVTAIINSRINHVRLDGKTIRAIALCVGGVALFVGIAASTAESPPITETQLAQVLVILSVVLVGFAVAFGILRHLMRPLFYVVGAGVLFGFVATLAKVVIDRVKTLIELPELTLGASEWLTLLCVIGIVVAALLGSYFVQTAYSNGPPDLVVAGLTVIDPIVAITVSAIVLGEAKRAEWWQLVIFVIAGAVAILGVFLLARHHPQTRGESSAESQ